MKSLKNAFIVLLALLLLGGGVLAWNQYQELIRLRVAIGSGSDRADLERRLADLQRRLKATQDQLAAARALAGQAIADSQDATGTDLGNAPPAAGRRGNRGGPFGGFQALMNNPQVQKLMAIQMKSQLDARYAALFKSLNLSPEQVDQLKNLLVQKQQAQQDARMAAMQQGLNPRTDPEAFQQAIASAQAGVDTQIQSQLGTDGYAQYQQYQQTLPQRNTVTQVQQSLSYTSAPLTDEQSSQLLQILSQNSGQTANAAAGGGGGGNRGGGGFGGFGGGNQGVPITNEVITAAQTVLSAPQLQALQQLQQQQQAQQQIQQMLRASRQNAGGGGGGAGGGGGGGGGGNRGGGG